MDLFQKKNGNIFFTNEEGDSVKKYDQVFSGIKNLIKKIHDDEIGNKFP